MRVFLRAPAADRMIVAPEGHRPGATPRLASARRQPGQRPPAGCCTGDSLGNGTGNMVGNITGKIALPEVLPAGNRDLTIDSSAASAGQAGAGIDLFFCIRSYFPQLSWLEN